MYLILISLEGVTRGILGTVTTMVSAGAGERSEIRPVSGILLEIRAGVRDFDPSVDPPMILSEENKSTRTNNVGKF